MDLLIYLLAIKGGINNEHRLHKHCSASFEAEGTRQWLQGRLSALWLTLLAKDSQEWAKAARSEAGHQEDTQTIRRGSGPRGHPRSPWEQCIDGRWTQTDRGRDSLPALPWVQTTANAGFH